MTTKGRPPKAQGETLARLSNHIKQLANSYHRLGKILVGLEDELVGNKHEERIKRLEDLNTATKLVVNTFDADVDKRILAIELGITKFAPFLENIKQNAQECVDETRREMKEFDTHPTRITALEEHIKYIINDVVDMFDKLKSSRIMNIEEVEKLTTLKRQTIGREEKKGTFPQHRQLTNKSIGWLASEIEEWITTHNSTPSCNLHKESKNEES